MTKISAPTAQTVLLGLLSLATVSNAIPVGTSSAMQAGGNSQSGFGLRTCLSPLDSGKCDGIEGDRWNEPLDTGLEYNKAIDLRPNEEWIKYDGTFRYFTLNGRFLYPRERLFILGVNEKNECGATVGEFTAMDFDNGMLLTQALPDGAVGACIEFGEDWECPENQPDCPEPNAK